MKTVVIIPAYNEENSIRQVIASIKHIVPEADIVVINDGSLDRTGEIARGTGHATVIDLPVNLGIGGAMQTGYLYAHRNG
jgi:glycosyltransferase involved in cell wall biosynthesis